MKKAINNFRVLAYNTIVEEITITQNGFNEGYIDYLQRRVEERFSFLPGACTMQKNGGDCALAFRTESAYCPYVRKFAEENIADVIAIGYKYAFFERRLSTPLLNAKQKRLLFTALVSADYQDDKSYALKRLRGFRSYSLDGVFHFRLQELARRWQSIADYVSEDLGESALDGFLEFLTEDGEGKLYVKDGKVYDGEYRLLSKSRLTGEESTIGEILLGNAEHIYCFGETERETAAFLRQYYGSKAVFCSNIRQS